MEHFTRSINDGVENGEEESNDLDTKVKEIDEIDIEALLNRSRSYGYKRRTKAFEEAPEFVRRLEPFVEVEAGTSLVFECQWKGFPRPSIKWYRDDEEITSDHPYYDLESEYQKGIARLVLSEVICQDEGAFKCKAENQEGVASTTGYLSVTGDKTLTLAQQEKKSSSPTSPNPCVSTAPHLRTILEQQSLEEREAEAQKTLPPSPLQDYIEIVQKSKTWPMARMGYNPEDFLPKSISVDTVEDSDSDTSVDSQTDDTSTNTTKVTVHTPMKQQSHNKVVITNGFNQQNNDLLTVENGDNDSVHSFDSSEDVDEDHGPPVCTVSVQMRSGDNVSRLTKIRQTEGNRLSLTLSETSETGSFSELEHKTNLEEDLSTPVVNGDIDTTIDTTEHEADKLLSYENLQSEVNDSLDSNTLWFFDSNNMLHEDESIVETGSEIKTANSFEQLNNSINESSVVANNTENNETQSCPIESVEQDIANEKTTHNENLKDNKQDIENTEKDVHETHENHDNIPELEKPHLTKLTKISSNSAKKAVIHQNSRDRKSKLKKQKSLVELSLEWIIQKITGKAGEQLDLPWIYYFAFTVCCACFAAAIRLNPLYMIIIIAILSVMSFRFLLVEEEFEVEEKVDVVTINDENSKTTVENNRQSVT